VCVCVCVCVCERERLNYYIFCSLSLLAFYLVCTFVLCFVFYRMAVLLPSLSTAALCTYVLSTPPFSPFLFAFDLGMGVRC
jgi:hypothetical protein